MIQITCRTIGWLSGLLGGIAALVLVPLIFASVYEVISRYVFNRPTIWAYEVGYMAMGASFLLAACYALRDHQHVRVDVFVMNASPRTRAAIDAVAYLVLFLPVSAWLTWELGVHAHESYVWGERSGESAWNPLIWPYFAMFTVSFAALTLQGVAELLKNLEIFFTGRSKGMING